MYSQNGSSRLPPAVMSCTENMVRVNLVKKKKKKKGRAILLYWNSVKCVFASLRMLLLLFTSWAP